MNEILLKKQIARSSNISNATCMLRDFQDFARCRTTCPASSKLCPHNASSFDWRQQPCRRKCGRCGGACADVLRSWRSLPGRERSGAVFRKWNGHNRRWTAATIHRERSAIPWLQVLQVSLKFRVLTESAGACLLFNHGSPYVIVHGG